MDIKPLLDANFITFPEAYRKDMAPKEREAIISRLTERAKTALAEEGKIPAMLLYKISFYPESAEALLYSLKEAHGAFGIIAASNPEAVLRILMHNYDDGLGTKLEILLLSNPDACLKLLEWSFATKTPLHYNEEAYLNSIFQDFPCAWAYSRKFRNGNAGEFLEKMKSIHDSDSRASPQGAFYRMCFGGTPPSGPMLNLLKLDPKTAVMTSVLHPETAMEILMPWASYPIWAYHIMRNVGGLPNELAQHCMQTLTRALPWMYQYLTEINEKQRQESSYNRLMASAVRKWQE